MNCETASCFLSLRCFASFFGGTEEETLATEEEVVVATIGACAQQWTQVSTVLFSTVCACSNNRNNDWIQHRSNNTDSCGNTAVVPAETQAQK